MEEVIVQQTVHGYSDGHSLLASSADLTSEEKFVLLKMTDLPGSVSGSDFEPYITAYPLSNQFYAVAKTWPAPEMHRPGCVWTHTILIPSATLGRIENLGQLISLIKKPSLDTVRNYQQSISFSQIGKPHGSLHTQEFLDLQTVLYGSNKAIILLSPPTVIEQLLFDAWSYQWPRLRRAFSFSIGSFAPRFLANKPLDVQLMRQRDFHFGSAGRGDYAVFQSLNSSSTEEKWTDMIRESDMNEVLAFMYKYGSDVDPIRTKYVDLFLAFQISNDLDNLESPINVLFSFFKTHFQDRSEAKSLKRDLILRAFEHDKRNLYYFLVFANETSNNAAPFSELNWNYPEIIQDLWSSEVISLHELQSLLTYLDVSKVGIEFFSKMPVEGWINNQYVTKSFASELMRLNAQLLASDTIWTQEREKQALFYDAFKHVLNSEMVVNLLPQVIESMVRNNNDLFAKDLVTNFPSEAITEALKASAKNDRELPAEWERQALAYPSAIIDHAIEGKITNYKLSLLLKIVNDMSSVSDTNRIVSLVEKINKVQNGMVLKLNCIFLAKCFRNQIHDSGRIFAKIFQGIHDLAKTGHLNNSDWETVYYSMPKNKKLTPNKGKSWFFGVDEDEVPFWDRCEFMRRGLLESFVQYNWPIDNFFQAIHDNDTLKRTAKFAVKSDAGLRFMIEVLQSHAGRRYPDQIKTINKVIEKRK